MGSKIDQIGVQLAIKIDLKNQILFGNQQILYFKYFYKYNNLQEYMRIDEILKSGNKLVINHLGIITS